MSNRRPGSPAVLKVEGLRKTFHQGEESLTVLQDVAFAIEEGEIVALVGPSGAGKSTLLQMVGLLDAPTSGQIMIAGQDVSRLSEAQRTLMRRSSIGFVYQFHYLMPEFSALENVIIPQMIANVSREQAAVRAERLLAQVGLAHRLDHRPARLSGGEQQRVAIVRALANGPKLLLADEPTGNLDPHTSNGVFDMLVAQARGAGIGALIATHNMELAERMDRILELRDGRVVSY